MGLTRVVSDINKRSLRAWRQAWLLATAVTAVVLLGCAEAAKPSSSTPTPPAAPKSRINPPEWIRGVWEETIGQRVVAARWRWEFTASNAVGGFGSTRLHFPEYGDSVAKATDTMFSLTKGRDDEFYFVFHRLADEEKLRYEWGIGRAAFPPLELTKATGR